MLKTQLLAEKQALVELLERQEKEKTAKVLENPEAIINYMSNGFPWAYDLQNILTRVFHIENFKHCQIG